MIHTDLLEVSAVRFGHRRNRVADLYALGGGDIGGGDNDLKHAILALERIGIQDKAVIGIGLVLALAVTAQLRGNILRLAERLDSSVGVAVKLNGYAVIAEDQILSGQSAPPAD